MKVASFWPVPHDSARPIEQVTTDEDAERYDAHGHPVVTISADLVLEVGFAHNADALVPGTNLLHEQHVARLRERFGDDLADDFHKLDSRAIDVLRTLAIKSAQGLATVRETDILGMRGVGRKTLRQLRDLAIEHGVSFLPERIPTTEEIREQERIEAIDRLDRTIAGTEKYLTALREKRAALGPR